MVGIRTLRYLLSEPTEQAPESPRSISSLEPSLECFSDRPCLLLDCRLCCSLPMVVLSSDSFCKKHDVGLRNVRGFVESGQLVPSARAGLLIVAHSVGTHLQVGVCCAVSIEDYHRGVIRKHEQTIVSEEDPVSWDRLYDQVR